MIVTIHNCARCKGDHRDLEFVEFLHPIESSGDTHWAMCPVASAPILLSVVKEDNNDPDNL